MEHIRLWEDLINECKYLMEGNKEDGARILSVVSCDRTRSSGHKLKFKKFYLNIGRNFLNVKVVKQ